MDAIVVSKPRTHVLKTTTRVICRYVLTCTIGEVTVLRIYLSMIMVIKMLNRRRTVNICQRMEGQQKERRRDEERQS